MSDRLEKTVWEKMIKENMVRLKVDGSESTYILNEKKNRSVEIHFGARNLIVSGNNSNSVLSIPDGGLPVISFISDVTIANGKSSFGGGINFRAQSSSLTLRNTKIASNTAIAGGGGINSDGNGSTFNMMDCMINGNTSGLEGGGVASFTLLIVSNCTFSGNSVTGAVGDGGAGIYKAGAGEARISKSLI